MSHRIEMPARLFEIARSTAMGGFPVASDGTDHPAYGIAAPDQWEALGAVLTLATTHEPTVVINLPEIQVAAWSAVFDVMVQGPEEGDPNYVSDADCEAIEEIFSYAPPIDLLREEACGDVHL